MFVPCYLLVCTKQAKLATPAACYVCVVFGTGLNRRCLGNNFDQRLRMTHSSFVVTADNRFILAVGFWDKSFRVFGTDLGNSGPRFNACHVSE